MPVVWAEPLVPPAICWSMVDIDTGSTVAPTFKLALTPVGVSPRPGVAHWPG